VVRIDMLERLADLIRDRVFWRPRIPDEKRPIGSVEGGGFAVAPDMMSLVGCSGEEFLGILRSLDFRMQKKRVKRPAAIAVPALPPAVEAASPPQAAAPIETAEPAEAVAPSEVAVAEAAPAEAITELAAELAAEAPATAPEPPVEEIEIEVWWPRDTGPFRHREEKKKHQRRPEPAKDKQEAPGEKRPERGQRPRREDRPKPPERRPPRPEKPIDPDSPFAVLSALKAKMAGNKN
jgi:ATP-dependent RNA helicase SUPV3L1/SUV3